jgi:hypothetical protein
MCGERVRIIATPGAVSNPSTAAMTASLTSLNRRHTGPHSFLNNNAVKSDSISAVALTREAALVTAGSTLLSRQSERPDLASRPLEHATHLYLSIPPTYSVPPAPHSFLPRKRQEHSANHLVGLDLARLSYPSVARPAFD